MTAKKVIKKNDDFVEITETVSDEAKILGDTNKTIYKKYVNYENPTIIYKITNLKIKNNPLLIKGDLIETFIGTTNKIARDELKSGAKTVITKDINGDEIYKIEVINK